MTGRPKCQGPGGKEIFASRAEAILELKTPRPGREANATRGGVDRCAWGDHYHITRRKRNRRKRMK